MALPHPFISVVITVKNTEETIAACLQSLLALDYEKTQYEIIIVDAFSTDATAEIIRRYAATHTRPTIKLVQKEGYIGAGRNEGIRHARGDFIAVTDGDMVVSKQWLKELLAGFTEDSIAVVGGPNNSAKKDLISTTVSCIPVHGPTLDEIPIFGKTKYGAQFVSDSFLYTTVCRNSMFRKPVLAAVGFFDEELIATEDPELNMRILKAGYKLAYNPKALVYHHHRNTLGGFYRQQRNYAFGQALANKKHPEMKSAKQLLPSIAFFSCIVLLSLSLILPLARWLVLVGVSGAVLFLMYYGIKCAAAKKDARLIATIPIFFIAWQFAWVTGFLAGALKR